MQKLSLNSDDFRAFISYIFLVGYFLQFILEYNLNISFNFYNDYRITQLFVLLAVLGLNILYKKVTLRLYDIVFLLALFSLSFFWNNYIFTVVDCLLFYLLFKVFENTNYQRRFYNFLSLASLVIFLMMPLSLYAYINSGTYNQDWYPLSFNIRVYDSYLLVIAIFSTYFYLKNNKLSSFYLLFLFLSFFAILLDGGRSTTLAYTIFIAIVVLFQKPLKTSLIATYFASWTAYISISYIANLHKPTSLRIVRESSSGRIELWQHALECWSQHPIVGCGFYQLDQYPRFSAHPHNLFIQILTENGIVGFGFLVFIIYKVIINISWNIKNNYFVISALLAVFRDMSLSGAHVYPVTQMALLWLFIFLLKNPNFEHAKYFEKDVLVSSNFQQLLSVVVYILIAAFFIYISIQAFNFPENMPMTPPRFWGYGYKLY